MLEKPDLTDEALAACLFDDYGLRAAEVTFLPLGADQHTAVYRVAADEGSAYFLKLRSGDFDDSAVEVPRLLCDLGVAQVIPPIPTRAGRLWTRIDRFAVVLYPFVAGSNGYTTPLSDAQWIELGEALGRLHATRLPAGLARNILKEMFAPDRREALRNFQVRVERERFDEPVAAEMATLLRAERGRVSALLLRAEELAAALRARTTPQVLCHGDMHPGNVLISGGGALHVVDWDTLIFAPREHDLALIGATWGGERELELFRRGYGLHEPEQSALAYYRYHRIVEDLAVVCEELLTTDEGGANRASELSLAVDTLLPGHDLDVAHQLDRRRS